MVKHEIAATAEQLERGSSQRTGRTARNPGETLALVQGVYYLVTGIWPLVSIRTFTMVTGPKTDLWLVKTVGVLAAVIGAVLESAGRRRRITREIHLLGSGSAAGFAAIDLVYVLRRRISPVYLLDAVVEAAVGVGWVLAWMRMRQPM